jgi:hypothetical protein
MRRSRRVDVSHSAHWQLSAVVSCVRIAGVLLLLYPFVGLGNTTPSPTAVLSIDLDLIDARQVLTRSTPNESC